MSRILLGLMLALGIGLTSLPAMAAPIKCPVGSVPQAGTSGDGFTMSIKCVKEAGGGGGDNQGSTGDPGSAGEWRFDGFVCQTGSTCSGIPPCPDGTPQAIYVFVLPDGSTGEQALVCPGDADEPETVAPTPPTPGEIFEAFRKVVPPKATLRIQPPNGKTLVNFETIFSTKADSFTTGSLRLGQGFAVTFDVHPATFTWDFGDGTTKTTSSAGKSWEPGADLSQLNTHVYTATDPVKASVTVSWAADYTLTGPGGPRTGTVDGTVQVASAPVPLQILEAKPELVE